MSGVTPPTLREFEGDMLVESADVVADDVIALTLVDPDGDELPPWTPGAHVDLILQEGLVRQYSLCSSPGDSRTIRLGILLSPDSRGGSRFVHEQLSVGSTVRVRGPRNHFPLVAAPRYVFIGGGIGITPMLPMIADAHASGADWHLFYGGRSRSSMGFLDELEQYGDRVTVVPQDEQGILNLDAVLGQPDDQTLVYVCGPEGLLGAVEERCARDWPAGALHLERFSAKEIQAPAEGERSFELELAASGVTLTVPPDKSVFDVIQDAGISVLGSCHEGVCGTCEQIVLEGDVDHRDSVLSESEQAANDAMMVCVSRCRSDRLVLDL